MCVYMCVCVYSPNYLRNSDSGVINNADISFRETMCDIIYVCIYVQEFSIKSVHIKHILLNDAFNTFSYMARGI